MADQLEALAEFRHRVANDLALVASVIGRRRSQSEVLSTGEILDEATDALASLSLLYRQLHERGDPDDLVDVGRHLALVGARLDKGYLAGLGITLYVRAPADLAPLSVAHALSLIVLELVSNAARHGAPQRIAVELCTDGEDWSCCVSDDGRGLADAFSAPARGGLNYVGRLAAGLDGSLTISSARQRGTSMSVRFPGPACAT